MTTIALIGGGRMGSALLAGWVESGMVADDLVVAETDPTQRKLLEQQHTCRVVPNAAWAAADADVIVLAVKPIHVAEAIDAMQSSIRPDALVVSIAAGVTLATLEAMLPSHPVVRAMPNTPSLVRMGAAAIAAGALATDAHVAEAERLLRAVGTVDVVSEPLLDAVTGLSGSGPAYVFMMIEALIEAGVLQGLPRTVAADLVTQTLRGSAELLLSSGETPASLRESVTSPGGTTAAGLKALEDHGFRAAILDAVAAATQRSRELGQQH